MIDKLISKTKRRVSFQIRKNALKQYGLSFLEPNYIFFDKFGPDSVVIDVGCGAEAEFAMHLINTYGLTAFGVDPTLKHQPALEKLEIVSGGNFRHIDKAVSEKSGTLTFHQSEANESGSLLNDHTNVKNDRVKSYEVETLSISELKKLGNRSSIDFVKLDLEGAEFNLLANVSRDDLADIRQIFVEFHHHCITSYNQSDTLRIVNRIMSLGFQSHTIDDHNYLFYR